MTSSLSTGHEDEEPKIEAFDLIPISAPYYVTKLYGCMYNTQGGPRRSANCEILDVDGNPIPGLYSAGEMGCEYAYIYNVGGNISEAVSSGRRAARVMLTGSPEAGTVNPDAHASNALPEPEPVVPSTATYKDGSYVGTGIGIAGGTSPVEVTVTVEGGKISAVEVTNNMETPRRGYQGHRTHSWRRGRGQWCGGRSDRLWFHGDLQCDSRRGHRCA